MTFAVVGITIGIFVWLCLLAPDSPPPFSEEEWPAISEDEFIDRCPPGTDRDIALKIREIISNQLGIPYDHVYPEQEFVRDLGIC